MNLHNNIQSYIKELQELLNETDEQKLIDKAYVKWGEDDSRYEVLEQFIESSQGSSRTISQTVEKVYNIGKIDNASFDSFDKPADPPADTKPDSGGQNKPVK
ncbi:hypothetical protein QUF50_02180 [Thiotrichales bacterium HSG1]|nr:hypothetical protein [Thiotrichales bacterium HSG1]